MRRIKAHGYTAKVIRVDFSFDGNAMQIMHFWQAIADAIVG
jgi:hypothetical protein